MSIRYKNKSERYAFHMIFEGAAVLLVIGLISFDGRVQDFLFADNAAASPAIRTGLLNASKPLARVEEQEFGLTVEEDHYLPAEISLSPPESASSGPSAEVKRDTKQPIFPDKMEPRLASEFSLDSNTDSGINENSVPDVFEVDLPEQNRTNIELGWLGNKVSIESTEWDSPPIYDEYKYLSVDSQASTSNNVDSGLALDATADARLDLENQAQPMADTLTDGRGVATIPTANLIPMDPTWWITEYDRSQLSGRTSLRATLDEVVFVALRNSPQMTILNLEPFIQETFIREQIANFDWGTFAETRWNEVDEPNADIIRPGDNGRFVQREWTYEAGLNKRLFNGGDIRIGQNFGTLDNNGAFLNPPDQGSSRFIIDYTQPLLRGAGRAVNTSQIVLAELRFDATSSQVIQRTQEFIVDVIAAYWNLYIARVQLIQNRRSVERAEALLQQLRGRFGIDVSNEQLLRAEAAAAARRSDVIAAEYNLLNSQDILNNLVMGPESTLATNIELIPDGLDLPCQIHLSEERLVEVALHNRPEIREAFANIKTAAVNQRVQANSLLPRLDAIVQTYVFGLRGDKDFTSAFADQFRTGNPSYSAGLAYDLPVGNRAAHARVQRSQLETSLFQSELRKTMGDVILDARVAAREVLRLNQEMQNNYNALIKAGQELLLIQQRQQMGLDDRTGSLYIEDLLASQSRLTVAERRLAESQRLQAIALVDLKRATGELFRTGSCACAADFYASPIQRADVPPIVHKLVDSMPANENDFVPTEAGVKAHLEHRMGKQTIVEDKGDTVGQPLISLPRGNDFQIDVSETQTPRP